MLLGTFAISGSIETEQKKYAEVCKSYIAQAKAYEKVMDNTALSQETFTFYKEKMKIHCGSLTSKTQFERKSFTDLMMKSNVKDKQACKTAIAIASKYSKTDSQVGLIIAAYKENIADKCGSLVAAHVSNFCLYDEAK